MTQERRKHPRRAMKVRVTHRLDGAKSDEQAWAADLSEGGVFIHTRQRPTIGQSLEVALEAPAQSRGSARMVRAKAKVARVSPEGIAARFTQLDPDSALLLNLLLAV